MSSENAATQASATALPPDRPLQDSLTPADRYGELFTAVQSKGVFADSKVFVDCAPLGEPRAILQAYRQEKDRAGFDLAEFVKTHFALPRVERHRYVSPPGHTLAQHIDDLWGVLTRHPRQHPANASLLALPCEYVVPGGRFDELYYWDSYFTMIGVAASGRADLVQAMTDNFAHLIDTYGHVPNGTRTYYLSRSQPPVFAFMTELNESCGGQPASSYLAQLWSEYAYWMDGADALEHDDTHRRVVCLADGTLLNRYWDDRDTPREESYIEDVATAGRSRRPASEVYRDLRAAAESGWDFSSRWLSEGPTPGEANDLATICTTSLLPVDLNAFLFKLEHKLGELCAAQGDAANAEQFGKRAHARQAAITRLMWSEEEGAFFDYDFRHSQRRRSLTAATFVPLFVGMATTAQAQRLAATLQQRLLAPGGLSTTEVASGQQWDRPNGWAPLQWMAIRGLARYGFSQLSNDIASRWLNTVAELYEREAKLVEKYAIRELPHGKTEGGGGGEYPLQDGFGWTNGVTRCLLQETPAHGAHGALPGAAAM